jgi:hypothetical protein
MKAIFIVVFLLLAGISSANAATVCASLPSMEACIKCGTAKYGLEAQTRHCQSNWRPGQQVEKISNAEADRRFGNTKTGKCGAGQITCSQWCAKYRPGASDCMSGHPNSCAKKPGGARACVGDVGR